MSNKVVLVTGASGSMGSEVLKQVLELDKANGLVLLRKKPANEKLKVKLEKKYGDKIEVVFGDLSVLDDCKKVIEKCDYILHCAAIIPPTSDHNPKLAEKANYLGAQNIVQAIKECSDPDNKKFVSIGTIAEYGNRHFPCQWGRVGDPLAISVYDYYAVTKIRGERVVVESDLKYWVSLRQSGILYDDILKNNNSDGLMFHNNWNTFIEWATSKTSGLMLKNLVSKDMDGSLPYDFWRNVYNIGNGKGTRVTGYETVAYGFDMMGRKPEDIFDVHWAATRNFHCFWYLDSYKLNDYLDFQYETADEFFGKLAKKLWYFKLGKPFPKLIKKMAIAPLLKDTNAPVNWVEKGLEGRISAFYGSKENYEKVKAGGWENFQIIPSSELNNVSAKEIMEQNGNGKAELLDLRGKTDALTEEEIAFISDNEYKGVNKVVVLSHGYDESKPDSELDIEDMKGAAKFRGGKCLSETMTKGDLRTKLKWECHDGHTFEAAPFTILKAGFWCPDCCQPAPWNFDALAKKIPFYAQVWYNSHSPEEDNFYAEDCYKDMLD